MSKKNITVVSDEELDQIEDRTRQQTPEGPELDAAFWKNATLVMPQRKHPVNLRLDADILAYFKAQGRGYQTRINAILRAYVEAQKTD